MGKVLVLQSPTLGQTALPQTEQALTLPERAADCRVLRIAVADDFQPAEELCAEWHAARVDFALLDDRAFAQFGLLVSDMDSTLITIECIDEIAAAAGLKAQVAEITERAMRGELDFAQSLRERVALLAGLPESVLDDVYTRSLQLMAGADDLLAACKAQGVKLLLVSGGFTFFTERLKTRLGLDWAYANELEIIDGKLSGRVLGKIVDAQAKADLLVQHREQLGLQPEQVIAVGDGANDIPMLQAAGVGIAYRAKPKTEACADACIRYGDLSALRGWFR